MNFGPDFYNDCDLSCRRWTDPDGMGGSHLRDLWSSFDESGGDQPTEVTVLGKKKDKGGSGASARRHVFWAGMAFVGSSLWCTGGILVTTGAIVIAPGTAGSSLLVAATSTEATVAVCTTAIGAGINLYNVYMDESGQ